VPPSASLSTLLNSHAYSFRDNAPRRRASLPPMALSKPLPPTPPPPPPPSLNSHRTSNQSFRSSKSSLRDGTIALASAPNRRPSKPIFHVLDSGSDREDDAIGEPLTESPKEIFLQRRMEPGKTASPSENSSLKAKRQDDIRRYHALTELLTTEEGYLMDLRELVNVSTLYSVDWVPQLSPFGAR
jgi:hypothetical protein